MNEARKKPTPNPDCISATPLPRVRSGHISATIDAPVAHSEPMAIPTRKRSTANENQLNANAVNPVIVLAWCRWPAVEWCAAIPGKIISTRWVREIGKSMPIVPLDGLHRADYPAGTPPYDVTLATGKPTYASGDEVTIKVVSKYEKPLYIELVGTSADGKQVILTKYGTKVSPNDSYQLPPFKVKPGVGKEHITMYACDQPLPEGKLVRTQYGYDRVIHDFYPLQDYSRTTGQIGPAAIQPRPDGEERRLRLRPNSPRFCALSPTCRVKPDATSTSSSFEMDSTCCDACGAAARAVWHSAGKSRRTRSHSARSQSTARTSATIVRRRQICRCIATGTAESGIVGKHAGGPDAEVASCLLWVGQIQDELSQYADAEKTFKNALQIELAIFGPDSPELTGCLSGLASVAADCGKFVEAEKLYRKIIAISEKSPNRNWRNYASNLDSLGLICRNLGKYAEAEPLQRCAVEIIRQLVGVNHQDYAIAIGNLASLFYVQKRYPEALPLFQQAVAIKEKTMPDRPSLAESLSSMGAIYDDFHNFPEAERLESRALAIYEKSLPPGDFMIAKSLQNLATYYNEEEKYDQAAPLFERSIAMMEKSLPDHPYLAMTLENFAILRHRQGKNAEAAKLYDRARQLLERTLGPNHPNVAECLYNSVTLFTSENRWQEAIEIVDRQRRIVPRHVEHVLPSLTARQQLLYLILHDNSPWAFALTLGLERRQTPGAATRSAEWLLNSKAIAQETLTRTACLMQGSNDPQVAATWAKLLDVRRQLAAGVVSDGNTGADSESQETAEQLSATEKKLAQQLADATGRNFPDDPWVQLDDVRRSIPADGVLINIARFDVFNFAGKTPAETWKAAHYAAWIVPPADQGDVKVVDLGEANIIDDVVEEFQKAMQAAAGAEMLKA